MGANGRVYGFSGSITGAATKTIVGVAGTTAVRPWLKKLIVSSNATPSSGNSSEWMLLRFTAAGTSTAVVPTAFDGDPAASSPCGKNHSAEPTYSPAVSLLDIAHNQLSTYTFSAGPGEEIVAPATAANGFGLQCQGVGGSGVAEICSIVFGE